MRLRLDRILDSLALGMAIHLPLRVRYWAAMQMIGRIIVDLPDPSTITLSHIFEKLDHPRERRYARSERSTR